ncbi:hypothetical protein F5148DRAFT_158341 [Russula earlei]|uniref:Uncharacterized protein n=1 Tax=Russula earlei TaxID=71964 RepID=A0ACC0UKD3_9AGAM|nr:hypothetical protein F5148DRAFT_158341 [Russula earlei]
MSSIPHQHTSYLQFQAIFDVALKEYSKKTGNDITGDPLTDRLKSCTSPEDVLCILEEKSEAFNDFRNGGRKVQLMNKLKPTVGILSALCNSAGLGNGIGLMFPPANAIFAGLGFLLSAANGVSSSYDTLMDLFECFESYLSRLRVLTQVPSSMLGILVKIMVELVDVLALATRQIKQGRFKKFAKKLLGEGEVEAVLHRLDRLTMEESRMTAAQTMEVVHGLFNNMKEVMDDGKTSIDNIRVTLDPRHSRKRQQNQT